MTITNYHQLTLINVDIKEYNYPLRISDYIPYLDKAKSILDNVYDEHKIILTLFNPLSSSLEFTIYKHLINNKVNRWSPFNKNTKPSIFTNYDSFYMSKYDYIIDHHLGLLIENNTFISLNKRKSTR